MNSIFLTPEAAELLDEIARGPCFTHDNQAEGELFANGLVQECAHQMVEITPLGEAIVAANKHAAAS